MEGIRRLYPMTAPLFVKHSGKCLDIEGDLDGQRRRLPSSGTTGAAATRSSGSNGWRPRTTRSSRSTATGSSTSRGVSTDNGAQVQQWDWWGGTNQRFRLDPVGHGYYAIVAKNSGRVLDVAGIGQDRGAKVIQWDWWGGDNQRWRSARPRSRRCTAARSSTSTGSRGTRAPRSSSGATGAAATSGCGSTRSATASTGSWWSTAACAWTSRASRPTKGARIIQWPYWGGDNQKWRPEGVGDGYIKFIAKHSGLMPRRLRHLCRQRRAADPVGLLGRQQPEVAPLEAGHCAGAAGRVTAISVSR